MKREENSSVSEFLLLGLPIRPEQQGMFFALFLGVYLTTVLGNLLIPLLIRLDPRLRTPMYFFLSHLAFTDVSFSSVTVPKMLINMQTQDQSIPYAGCITQTYFFLLFTGLDDFLLTSMAYDRYVAICHPLHYSTVMGQGLQERSMKRENQSSVSEFLLLGLPIQPEQQGVFFALFLGVYLTTVLGNLLIILLIRLDPRLHTPMYFFLSHLALTDVSFSSVTIPKMLINMQIQDQSIPYAGCITQTYFFLLFTGLDDFLLTSMAYDRYVAICHPLHYSTAMGQGLCPSLVTVSWILSCTNALCHTLLLPRLSFCADHSIPHFFCDLDALLKLSCSDTSLNELAIFTAGVAIIILPLVCILISYGRIGATILKVSSTKGICKALSTCGSHLSVVSLYYGTIIGLYIFPSSSTSRDKSTIASVMYTVVTPLLNPFIYSLRNRDMKGALERLLHKAKVLSQ
ncbi:olfactory receptor 1J4-like [Oryx dammah]|uniref:olfactory receptor 1J4-like n=1 Tax=Oryx dammah TaxID=59534 RepID=UPI001A9A8DB0|nr:olfactory receptor 1J4-like [Oryx dammah]